MQTTGTTARIDTAGLVRRVRRMADISQRELAERCGVSKATIGRIEVGAPIDAQLLFRILAEVDLRVEFVDPDGWQVWPMRPDAVHDRAGRMLPAHLDPRPVTFWWNRTPYRERDYERGPPNALFRRRPGNVPCPEDREDAAHDDHPTAAKLEEIRRRPELWG